MARRLHYLAVGFWLSPLRSERFEFLCALDAEEGGAILARTAAGVLVFQQWIDLEAQIYDEPEILAEHGQVPSGARSIDADGRDPWLDDCAA